MNDKEKVVDYGDLPEEAKEELSNGKEEGVDLVCPIQAQLLTATALHNTGMVDLETKFVKSHHIIWLVH